MNGCVGTNKDTVADDARFAVSPETAGDGFIVRLKLQVQIIAAQQRLERLERHVGHPDHVFAGVRQASYSDESCLSTIRTMS